MRHLQQSDRPLDGRRHVLWCAAGRPRPSHVALVAIHQPVGHRRGRDSIFGAKGRKSGDGERRLWIRRWSAGIEPAVPQLCAVCRAGHQLYICMDRGPGRCDPGDRLPVIVGSNSAGSFSFMFPAFDAQKNATAGYLANAPNLPPAGSYPAAGRGTADVSALGEGYQAHARVARCLVEMLTGWRVWWWWWWWWWWGYFCAGRRG